MRHFCTVLPALACLLILSPVIAAGNLLRNGSFQDDWQTLKPELKNHHWNYTTEVYNRRDYNPDGWTCAGSWDWQNADAFWGARRMVLRGPGATLTQAVNWVTTYGQAPGGGWPDAGGYPSVISRKSKMPDKLVRDLIFHVELIGRDVPENAGALVVAYAKSSPVDDPAGASRVAPVSLPIPTGTYSKAVSVTLPAASWLNAQADGTLPGSVVCEIKYTGAAGEVTVWSASLEDTGPNANNLLANGNFERLDQNGYPVGWSQPEKYFYFPPGLYYNFNTWCNSTSPNRGPVAADGLVSAVGRRSLKMIVASGDEKCVRGAPITLNQAEPCLIEVQALVKTDQLAMMQIDAENENGQRLDCFNFIHKQIISIGTDDWRLVRQVFAPAAPVKELTIKLCARGLNGYTLDDTSEQPQNNAVGMIWWDDVKVYEPESTAAELAARGVTIPAVEEVKSNQLCASLVLGDRMAGSNTLIATLIAPGNGAFTMTWEFTSPSGKTTKAVSQPMKAAINARPVLRVPYSLAEQCPAYSEYHGKLTLEQDGKAIASTELWFATWTTPIELELGNLYSQPDRKLFVRAGLGVSSEDLKKARTLRLEIVRRRTGEVVKAYDVPATPEAIQAGRAKIPSGLRDDFRNLILTDIDISMLPLQPFNDPQRNWFVRATLLDNAGAKMVSVDSQPFCRLAHEPPQPPVQTVRITADGALVNGRPWMPWGLIYGHNPVYDGPADPGGDMMDLHTIGSWGMYDRHGGNLLQRELYDANCQRQISGISKLPEGNGFPANSQYYASAYLGNPAFSLDELARQHGGKDKLDAFLALCKNSPMVVSTAPGIEEAFGYFAGATPEQLKAQTELVDYIRKATGKPVMVGHGGYWNRFEWEKALEFDIFDPETEPFYPAPAHTDMRPLIEGQPKTTWLRPQMYEDVPYERWRFHAFVEMMRGVRGWQIAHGPGDPTTFRGLHAEMEYMKPIIYSRDPAPKVTVAPWIEHWARQYKGSTYIVAATTHGMDFGAWRWDDGAACPAGRARVTDTPHEWRDESNGYSVNGPALAGPSVQGLQSLPNLRAWSAGTKVVQWVKLDPGMAPDGFTLLVKSDGRWTHAASWGRIDTAKLRGDATLAHWFIRAFYRHASGIIGWGSAVSPQIARDCIPGAAADMGALPAAGAWVKLEIPLDKLGITDKGLIDGIAALHDNGRIWWGPTTIVAPDGAEQVVFGDNMDRPAPASLKTVKISVPGLRKGAKVQVVFEDREIIADDGGFIDDFTGADLYQRFGGLHTGYGDTPVALHVYEIP